jgi:hypothetical protein
MVGERKDMYKLVTVLYIAFAMQERTKKDKTCKNVCVL